MEKIPYTAPTVKIYAGSLGGSLCQNIISAGNEPLPVDPFDPEIND